MSVRSGIRNGRSFLAGLAGALSLLLLGACAEYRLNLTGADSKEARLGAALSSSMIEEGVERAEAVLAAGEAELAEKLFTRALKENPADRRAQLGLAESNLAAHRAEKAYQMFRMIEIDGERSGLALQGEGIALAVLGRRNEAVPKLEEAVEVDAKLWRAWNVLGQIHDLRQEWGAASQCYEKAQVLAPTSAAVRNNVGVSLLLQGRTADAATAFRKALELNPALDVARANLRLALAGIGNYKEALAGANSDESAVIFNNVGYMAMARGDLDAAETLLGTAIEKSPSYYEKASRNLDRARRLRGTLPNS